MPEFLGLNECQVGPCAGRVGGLVEVSAPLLFCEVKEVRRLAAGILTAVTVTKRGKVQLIKNLAALEQLCVSFVFVYVSSICPPILEMLLRRH